jgi:hypothetical protein
LEDVEEEPEEIQPEAEIGKIQRKCSRNPKRKILKR